MHLFTYGTLMFPEVWQAVVGKEFQTLTAQLPNYQIFRVKDAVYPGIIAIDSSPTSDLRPPTSSSSVPLTSDLRPLTSSPVPGLLYLNLDPASLARLDAFEDDFYLRQTVTVTCEDGQELEAEAYIVPENRRDLLTKEIWTAEDFAARGDLTRFVARYAGFERLH